MATDSVYVSNAANLQKYLALPQRGQVIAEYVWIDANGGTRSKCKTLKKKVESVKDLPEWNFDGSSTGQAPGNRSEVNLVPRAIFRDPFRLGDNILVMCDCYDMDFKPVVGNARAAANEIFEKVKDQHIWFGMEQEYTVFTTNRWPLGWPQGGFPKPQGPYYCAAGTANSFGRALMEAHYRCCLYAGVTISGTNAEVMPGQWEFQVGPCEGISIGDHLWMARYLLHRLSEQFRIVISFDPKPMDGDWNGAGCHTNVSTEAMRLEGGLKHIYDAMPKLQATHKEHMEVYGQGNERRLTGHHETQHHDKFTFGVADRGASVRIPSSAAATGKGYFEDRRPASNCDPYVVCSKIAETICL